MYMNENNTLSKIRHSLAHVLAYSVKQLYPGSQNAIGPAIEDGFYQDFEINGVISEDDLQKIEQKMKEVLALWNSFERREIDLQEALEIFKDNKYKKELAQEFANDNKTLTIYTSGDFVDLCKGGHVDTIGDINPQAFTLTKTAGAYWKGDEKNIMLTRVYGLAFETKDALNDHIKMLEEAKERDHRKLGKELDLFTFSPLVGKGLPLWTERGATVRRELERFIVDEEIKRGYKHVVTPDIASIKLFETSGHYPYYKESMYSPIDIDGEKFMLRPMTCPHHFQLYLDKPRTYKDLPMRIAELGKLYRYEQSGELSGLIRVRSFTLADSHIICTPDQAKTEAAAALDLIEYCAQVFGLEKGKDYRYRLSLGDRSDESKYFKDDAAWESAEGVLRELLQERNEPFYAENGEAAFYGPKIDVQMKNVTGKEDTAFTVQYDFVMPKRFNLTYKDSHNTDQEAVVVHRSSIGAIERVIAFLIENTAGRFPIWLAPEQIRIIQVKDSPQLSEFVDKISGEALENKLRVTVDRSNESVSKKIRMAETMKIPYIIVVGEKELETGLLKPRIRKDLAVEGRLEQEYPRDIFIHSIANEVRGHVQKSSL